MALKVLIAFMAAKNFENKCCVCFSKAHSGSIIWINNNRNDAIEIIQNTKASLILCGTENKSLADISSREKS